MNPGWMPELARRRSARPNVRSARRRAGLVDVDEQLVERPATGAFGVTVIALVIAAVPGYYAARVPASVAFDA